ncbi:MAG: type II toxin-antitoxin system RelE/ParE family toxin [Methylocystis sp.]
MRIRSVRHRGLKRFIEDDDDREIRRDLVNRVRRITGDRTGTWSISVSGNWRITFTLEDGEIANLNLEDYH